MARLRMVALLLIISLGVGRAYGQALEWKAGIAKAVITPETPVWLAGYGMRREPTGKLHDLWAKTIALEDDQGHRAVLVTTDHMGIPKDMYESMARKARDRFGLDRSQVMFTFSHNHCGPRLRGDLVDYYPIDQQQTTLVDRIHRPGRRDHRPDDWRRPVPARTGAFGHGCRRMHVRGESAREYGGPGAQLRAEGKPLKGVVDHSVPVLAVYNEQSQLQAILFGYACHPTTLAFTQWCGDYPGFAQVDLEDRHPGVTAMFINTCGGDQNPIPRLNLELCEQYGHQLAASVEEVLQRPLKPIPSGLSTKFEFVDLAYEHVMTRTELESSAASDAAIHARWAQRLLEETGCWRNVRIFLSVPGPCVAARR